jgi:hypothetical protein
MMCPDITTMSMLEWCLQKKFLRQSFLNLFSSSAYDCCRNTRDAQFCDLIWLLDEPRTPRSRKLFPFMHDLQVLGTHFSKFR